MSKLYELIDELETILYKVGDAPTECTEDELMNMLIGVIQLHKVRYEKMWASWDQFQRTNRLGDYADQHSTANGLEQHADSAYDRHDLGETNPYYGMNWPNDFSGAHDTEPMK